VPKGQAEQGMSRLVVRQGESRDEGHEHEIREELVGLPHSIRALKARLLVLVVSQRVRTVDSFVREQGGTRRSARTNGLGLRALAEDPDDLALVGESPRVVLGEDDVTVHDHIEDAVVAPDELRLDAQLFGQPGPQTGGTGKVASTHAVDDGDLHRSGSRFRRSGRGSAALTAS